MSDTSAPAAPVSVVATSAYATPEFWISVIGLFVLIFQAPEVGALIPPAYQPIVTKFALAAATVANFVGTWLRNRPTQFNLFPGQTQKVLIDPIAITQAEVKNASSTPTVK